jgi:hypothetical protein
MVMSIVTNFIESLDQSPNKIAKKNSLANITKSMQKISIILKKFGEKKSIGD